MNSQQSVPQARSRSLMGNRRLLAVVVTCRCTCDARRPKVLVADEPLVGLAPADQEALAAVLKTMAGDGTAVVTCGHDVPVLLSVSDVIIWSVAGTTHHLGTPAEALAHAQFTREYLGPRFDGTEWATGGTA